MPELGEVAHAVGLLRKYILNQTIKSVSSSPDPLLYVPPLTNTVFDQALRNNTITNVGRNGKYFMMEIGNSETLVLHFGMTGWIRVKDVDSIIMMESGGDRKQKQKIDELIASGEDPTKALWATIDWPPKFTKFMLTTETGTEIAFSDPRRLARVRFLDVPLSEAGKFEPLSKLGTDFSQLQPPAVDIIPQIIKRRVPVKSLLLDQSLFSGIGNWMADEILHLSRLHPEQYANTLNERMAAILYDKILEVCRIAAATEGNSAAFPSNWLMLHRWGKGRSKKETQKTADGHIVSFVSVGGRTSCFVPAFQKKFKTASEDEDASIELKSEEPESEVKESLTTENSIKLETGSQNADRTIKAEFDHREKLENQDSSEITADSKPSKKRRRMARG